MYRRRGRCSCVDVSEMRVRARAEEKRDPERPGDLWSQAAAAFDALGRRRPGRAGRAGPADDAGAVARGARLPAAAGRGRGRRADHLAGTGAVAATAIQDPARRRRLADHDRPPRGLAGPRHRRAGARPSRTRRSRRRLPTPGSAETAVVEPDERQPALGGGRARCPSAASGCCGSWPSRTGPTTRSSPSTSACPSAASAPPAAAASPSCGRWWRQERADERTETATTLLDVVRRVWTERDPVPEGLVARMQAAAAAADTDLDVELMLLVERSDRAGGARGSATAYTLRFAHGELRAAAPGRRDDGEFRRIDGWVVAVDGDDRAGGRHRRTPRSTWPWSATVAASSCPGWPLGLRAAAAGARRRPAPRRWPPRRSRSEQALSETQARVRRGQRWTPPSRPGEAP